MFYKHVRVKLLTILQRALTVPGFLFLRHHCLAEYLLLANCFYLILCFCFRYMHVLNTEKGTVSFNIFPKIQKLF